VPRRRRKQAQQSVVLKRGKSSREGMLGVVGVPGFGAANVKEVRDTRRMMGGFIVGDATQNVRSRRMKLVVDRTGL
jgi:hypothetical protein